MFRFTSWVCLIFLAQFFNNLKADDDLLLKVGAYVDAYYSSDNDYLPNQMESKEFRKFSYVNAAKDEFGLNTAQITALLKYGNHIRGNVTIHAGDLKTSAWLEENKYIQQANGGVRLFDNLWLDAGYFLTHIGGEAVLPKDNWLTSHSLVTLLEPFYQAGFRLSYETEKFTGQIHLLNGYAIAEDNNYNKSLGWFAYYALSKEISLSYAGILGNEEPGNPSNSKVLQLHNFVAYLDFFENLSMKAQVDFAQRQNTKPDGNDYTAGSYLGASFQARYKLLEKLNTTFRFSYINNDYVFPVYQFSEINGMDFTLGVEYKPTQTSFIRLEGRMMNFDDKYKLFNEGKDNSRMEAMLNIGIWID